MIGEGPFIRPAQHSLRLSRGVLAASLIPATAGVVLFGFGAGAVIVFAAGGALAGDIILTLLTERRVAGRWEHSLTAGVLLALTLPAESTWDMAVLGGVISSAVGYGMFGGYGNHLWHPALVGRAVVGVFYSRQLTPATYGLLGRGHLFWGNLSNRQELPTLSDWWNTRPALGIETWDVVSPVVHLRSIGGEPGGLGGEHPMMALVRDRLPDWGEMILGLTGGGLGETCIAALVGAGLWLIYQGVVRWQLPAAMIGGAAVAAAVLPLRLGGTPTMDFFPGCVVWEGIWLGGIYVAYQVVSGEIMLCAMLLTGDTVTSPLSRRGQIVFGAGVGILTMALRAWGIGIGAGYWAMLLMNTVVPLIDRCTKRRVLGV